MGEVGETDRHYGGNRARPAYPWQCPNCNANNIGRVEDGCPACQANKDGKVVGIPKVTRRTRSQVLADANPQPLRTLSKPEPIQLAAPAPQPLPAPVGVLVDAAVLVLQYVHGSTPAEVHALDELQRAVRVFLPIDQQAHIEVLQGVALNPAGELIAQPPPQLNSQLLDPRTILTIAAALDHFAEQVLAVAASPDFLSEDEAVGLAEQLRASLPEDLDQVLSETQPAEQEPEA